MTITSEAQLDLTLYGQAFEIDGQRVDPSRVKIYFSCVGNMPALLSAGQRLSNFAFNLAQQSGESLSKADCATLRQLCDSWDEARRDAKA